MSEPEVSYDHLWNNREGVCRICAVVSSEAPGPCKPRRPDDLSANRKVADPEDLAWAWLDCQTDAEPADCSYGADEMVDAFLAGRLSVALYDVERLAIQHASMRKTLQRISDMCPATADLSTAHMMAAEAEATLLACRCTVCARDVS